MSLEDYKVNRDKFVEAKNDMTILCFPCYCCLCRNKTQDDEPCRTCGHNLLSVDDDNAA